VRTTVKDGEEDIVKEMVARVAGSRNMRYTIG
jgi:hypothetical protein